MRLTGQVLEGRVCPCAGDSDLAKHGEGDTVGATHKALDLPVAVGLLLAKLVAGETKHVEVLGSQVPLQLLQSSVVLLCEATLAGHIHHQGHLRGQNKTLRPAAQ